jgi:tetratricopeptide (TPR) repeat protein
MKSKERVIVFKGIDLVKRGQFQEALEMFDRVLEMNQDLAEAWNNRGVALFRLGQVQEALECYERAMAIEPGNLDALRNKAFVFRGQEKFPEALALYDLIIQAGGDVKDLEAKATVLVGLGRIDEALNILIDAAKIEPSVQIEEEIDLLMKIIENRTLTSSPEKESGD